MKRFNKKRKQKKKIFNIITSLLITLSILLYFYIFNQRYNNKIVEVEQNTKVLSINDESNKITINAIGDIMAHTSQLNAQHDPKTNTYSFDNNYKYVSKYIKESDLSIANLETTFAGDSIPYSSYPTFNTPDTLADALKNAGVDIVSTINNHSFDKGDLGVERTLEVLKNRLC